MSKCRGFWHHFQLVVIERSNSFRPTTEFRNRNAVNTSAHHFTGFYSSSHFPLMLQNLVNISPGFPSFLPKFLQTATQRESSPSLVLWPHLDLSLSIDPVKNKSLCFMIFRDCCSNERPLKKMDLQVRNKVNYIFLCVLSRFSHIWLFATPWIVAHQALLFMGLSRQKK